MKKMALGIGIATWTLVAVLLIGILVAGISGRFHMDQEGVLVKEENVSMDGLENLIVESSSIKVELVSTTDANLKVSQYGPKKTKQDELFTINTDGDAVHVKVKQRFRLFQLSFGFLNEKLVLEVPESFAGNADIRTSSGGIRLKDEFTLRDAALKSTSGGIRMDNPLTVQNLNLNVSSGGIHSDSEITVHDQLEVKSTSGGIHLLGTIQANYIHAKVSSGGMRLGETNVKEFDLKSTSGGIKVESISGGGSAKASSGGVTIGLKDPLGNVNLKSSSGGIKIRVEESVEWKFEGKCSSGSIKSNVPMEKNERGNHATAVNGENPQANIYAESSSGGIRLDRE